MVSTTQIINFILDNKMKGLKMTRLKYIYIFGLFLIVAVSACAVGTGEKVDMDLPIETKTRNFELASPFTEHMVLQRGRLINVWGWGQPEEMVKVSIDRNVVEGKVNSDGQWQLSLPEMEAGGPHVFTAVSGSKKIKYTDVLIGDVFLASGQSNMQMKVRKEEEIAAHKPGMDKIRHFQVDHSYYLTPRERVSPKKWTVCRDQENVREWSGVAWAAVYRIYEKTNIPIGLIQTALGGTQIEPWIPLSFMNESVHLRQYVKESESFRKSYASKIASGEIDPDNYEKYIKHLQNTKTKPEQKTSGYVKQQPSILYNSMIHPFIKFQIRGIMYYQGESSRFYPDTYADSLLLMVRSYRKLWKNNHLHFSVVQLPALNEKIDSSDPNKTTWAWIREAQSKVLQLQDTGLAVVYDNTETSLHPKDKSIVGERLARIILHDVYGKKNIAKNGPIYESHKLEGNTFIVKFSHATGLKTNDGESPKAFRVAGEDKVWHMATSSRIEGDKVVVSSDKVIKPVALRYAWDNRSAINLYNEAGLPTMSFRTDDWQRIDRKSKSFWSARKNLP